MVHVSAVLCVLNEYENIQIILDNINHLSGCEIIIVDGGSCDGTYEALNGLQGVTLVQLKKRGLLAQRLVGIEKARHELVFLFNADDRLAGFDISKLTNELLDKQLHGLNLKLKAPKSNNFWEKCWTAYFAVCIPVKTNAKVLGRPCLTYKELFSGITSPDNMFNEDTYLRFEQQKVFGDLLYNYSHQAIIREVPNTLGQNINQFRRYGVSDNIIARSSIAKRMTLAYHSFIRIAIFRTLRIMISGKPQYAVFTLLLGVVRGFYLLKGLWK